MYIWFYVIVLLLKVSLDPISAFWYSPTFCYFSHKYQIVVCKLFQLSELLSFAELVPQLCTEAAPVCLTLTCYYREQCSFVSPLLMCSLRHTQKNFTVPFWSTKCPWFLVIFTDALFSSHFTDGSVCIQFSASYFFLSRKYC